MLKSLPFFMAGIFLVSAGAAQAHNHVAPEARLEKILAGRTAGTPTDCIQQNQIASSQIIDGTAIVYRMNGGTIYVNRPSSGASMLRSGNVLMTDTHSNELCSIDIVRLLDSGSHMPSGTVGLGQFIPYPRPPRGSAG